MAKRRDVEHIANESEGPKVGRRGFLVGTSLTAAAAAAIEGCRPAEVAKGGVAPVVGPSKTPVTLTINGAPRTLEIEPRTTLADALRFELGLTGTKVVCDRGSCSACTVWLDDTPVCACLTFALDVGARAVTTIEGLAKGDDLHPVQEAFIEHDAMQCGFCTPGMIMSCAALLKRTPRPSLDDVRTATSGNLCRCGTYPKVFEATLAAAAGNPSKRTEG
jgi:aerobic-type carbon monoxide dehydrogenase small subunit (CoxS/CutS family)